MRAAFIQSKKHLIWVHVGNDVTDIIPARTPSQSQGWTTSGSDLFSSTDPFHGPFIKSGADLIT